MPAMTVPFGKFEGKTVHIRTPGPQPAASARDVCLRLESLGIRRGGRAVLNAITLGFLSGEITAVVGPSGVGKTTLIHLLNGLQKPSSGSIGAAGIGDLRDRGNLRRHRLQTATVFQDYALIDRLSAMDNVLLGLAERRHPLALRGWPEPMRLQAAAALAEVGMLAKAGQRASRLSGGERQRVAIARALVREPRLLLADEPFASTDPATAAHLCQELRRRVEERRITAIVVLHQVEIARRLADRIVGLNRGRVVFDAPSCCFDAEAAHLIYDSAPEP